MAEFIRTYGKTLAAALAELVLALQAYVSDGVITGNEWQKLAIGAVGVLAVFFSPARTNQPPLTPQSRSDLRDRL